MALTAKTKLFADVHNGNTTEAAAIAGISRGHASHLMMDVAKSSIPESSLAVQERIKARNVGNEAILTRVERQELWSKWTKGTEKPTPEQLKASELLGKSELDFGERHVDETPQTLADIAALMGHRRRQIESKASNVLEGTVVAPIAAESESKENEDG